MNLKKIIIFSLLVGTLVSCSDNIDNNKNTTVSPETIEEAKKDLGIVSNLKTVGVDVFKKEIEKNDGILVDLRTAGEIAQGVIEGGAINIDFYSDDFKEQINKLDKNKKYLIYCRSGARSGRALDLMENLGFKNVTNLSGGIGSWARSGGEVVDFEEKIKQANNISTEKIIILEAKNWEFDKKEIRVKKGEKVKIKVNNLDGLHGIAIPDMQLTDDNEITVDTSKTGTFTYQCLNYCGDGHSNMTGTLIIE